MSQEIFSEMQETERERSDREQAEFLAAWAKREEERRRKRREFWDKVKEWMKWK